MDGDLGPRALQGPAARIWSALGSADDPRSEEDLVRSVADEFGIDVEEIRAQAIAFLWDLERIGLVRRVEFRGNDHDGPL
ncbi:PqqD family protein [Paenarthrobacter sp. NPDC058040]|uniref:PqqD family protein n=1 Tax=unclassified Paenarthrobacter TaxID=2634190 RepID=UPI0036DFA024